MRLFFFSSRNSLFSGDSKGNVSVWDVDIGVMASTFKTHTVDVLALAASTDQNTVFATGVDPTIRRFDLCITERSSKFISSKTNLSCRFKLLTQVLRAEVIRI